MLQRQAFQNPDSTQDPPAHIDTLVLGLCSVNRLQHWLTVVTWEESEWLQSWADLDLNSSFDFLIVGAQVPHLTFLCFSFLI
jgi:hypothetical protein